MEITIEELEKLGFKDQTHGWGGSQGMDWIYKKENPPITIRQYAYNEWRLEPYSEIKFSTIEEIENYCNREFGVGIK
jgi:hypothetical protein